MTYLITIHSTCSWSCLPLISASGFALTFWNRERHPCNLTYSGSRPMMVTSPKKLIKSYFPLVGTKITSLG